MAKTSYLLTSMKTDRKITLILIRNFEFFPGGKWFDDIQQLIMRCEFRYKLFTSIVDKYVK